eukprot:NODE_1349_length_989_cov_293.076596_g939_i0.p2 GENE.NODE_1349_length_989_cov_293.076596_g939_i0~~NODE_1349_length_989_cov_293.076596_g939_i0.p2  ORF type:complete len:127 (+),score=50.72 NODE_1349_length_989_cov_293.076596_g939_i0:32-412(+)
MGGEPMLDTSRTEPEPDQDTIPREDDDEVVLAIKELLDARVKPMVHRDGGNIKYVGFADGIVYLQMQGACSSCPSSSQTLKGGIERMMMHWIPEVVEVRAVEQEEIDELNVVWESQRRQAAASSSS